MNTVKSTAWDRSLVAMAVVFGFCLLASIISLIGYSLHRAGGVYALGTFMPPGIGAFVLAWWTFIYTRAAHCKVAVTEETIDGIAGSPIIRFGDITRWELRGKHLLIWARRARQNRYSGMRVLRLGVPLAADWTTLDPAAIPAISQALCERVGPPGIDLAQHR